MAKEYFAVVVNPKNGDFITFENARGHLRKWRSVGAARRFLTKNVMACSWGATIHDYDGYVARFTEPDSPPT